MELDVTGGVEAFREILSAGWPAAKRISLEDTTGSFLDDWMQANWEMVVEASIPPVLNVILEPYGAGADCNLGSSRIWRPNVLPTSPVFIRYIGNEPLMNVIDDLEITGQLILDYFCTLEDAWPAVDLPFDYVSVQSETPVVVPVDQLRYYVEIER
jgi:hypothetical protein